MSNPKTAGEWIFHIADTPVEYPPAQTLRFALTRFINWETGNGAYPSRTTLAKASGLSRPTITRALTYLAEKGILKRERRNGQSSILKMYPNHTDHTRNQSDDTPNHSEHTPNQSEQYNQSVNLGFNQSEEPVIENGVAVLPTQGREIKPTEENRMKISEFLEARKSPDIEEIFAKLKKKGGTYSATSLGNLWVSLMAHHYPDVFTAKLKVHELGKMKSFITQVPCPDELPRILLAVISNWDAFTKCCCEDGGGFKPPAQPTFQWFALNMAYAVNWYEPYCDTGTREVSAKPDQSELLKKWFA